LQEKNRQDEFDTNTKPNSLFSPQKWKNRLS